MANTHTHYVSSRQLALAPNWNVGSWLVPGFWMAVLLLALVFLWLG
jgi:hypothetical protein